MKTFVNHDWVWVEVSFRLQNLDKRGVTEWKECNPTLVRKGNKYFLHFSYETTIKLNKTPLQQQRICAVDLGLTNSAVCSILNATGTVLTRKFINQTREKDQLCRITNYLRKAQSRSGYASMPRYWNRISGLQRHRLVHTASEIIQFAKEYKVDVIVFEFLGKMRTPKGFLGAKKLRFKLHFCCKLGIQSKVEEMAYYEGIRISRINLRNTSK